MANRVKDRFNDEIEYPFNINYIMKYKRGETYYFLTKVFKDDNKHVTKYDDLTLKPIKKPAITIRHIHAITGQEYSHMLGVNEKFTDRFEMVFWKTIPLELRLKIRDANEARFLEEREARLDVKCRIISHKHIEEDINNNINFIRYGSQPQPTNTGYITIGDNSTGMCITKSDTTETFNNTGYLIYDNSDSLTFDDPMKAIILRKKRKKRKLLLFDDTNAIILK